MSHEEISMAFRMIAMGRHNHETVQKLSELLAVVLATPEERLALTVQDEPIETRPETAIESTQTADAPVPDKPRRGRPPKQR
jgi:hypothetical protein